MEMYWIELRHDGLKQYRVLRDRNYVALQQKAAMQRAKWDEMWERRLEQEQTRATRQSRAKEKDAKKSLAMERTKEAQDKLTELRLILSYRLADKIIFDWRSQYDKSNFPSPPPVMPVREQITEEPLLSWPKYAVKLSFIERLFRLGRKKYIRAKRLYAFDHRAWEQITIQLNDQSNYELKQYEKALVNWKISRNDFVLKQRVQHESIDLLYNNYITGKRDAIIEFAELVLNESRYPDAFPKDNQVDFVMESKTLIVDYSLPAPACLPAIKEVKYNATKDELVDLPLKNSEMVKLYDEAIYQITLRTLHELFAADTASHIGSIVLNGWVRSIDSTTGKEVNAPILSIQIIRSEFCDINLSQVEPKACFKKLKGIGSSQLCGLSPIAPILTFNKNDARFIPSHEVMDNMRVGMNIATIDWQEFEHLVREIFSREFDSGGGEVKVTRASRDGGVDAIAFDPDPIRGGKIIIQAKRYTNTVDVSAVRDLFGTVHNEGAIKGILVTTSDYGPDAYAFAKDKPLTLMNGSQLLYLLQKHGHQARIDLKEAKEIFHEQEK